MTDRIKTVAFVLKGATSIASLPIESAQPITGFVLDSRQAIVATLLVTETEGA